MKTLLYLSKGGNIGGSQRQLCHLVTDLDKAYEPIVVCTSEGEFVGQLRSAGIRTEVLSLCGWRKPRNTIHRYVCAERLVRFARQVDPVLIHSSDMWLGNYLTWVGTRLEIPSVVHVRAPVGWADVRKRRLRRTTGIISISKRITSALVRAGLPSERIVQIEDGVDVELFRPCRKPLGHRAHPAVMNVGLVGRIHPSKRQMAFVKAARHVLADLPGRVRFFLVGGIRDTAYANRIKRFASANGLDGRLVFTGRQDDMASMLNSLDVLVSLSGGSVMYEAMSCGLCVVSAGFTQRKDSIHLRDGATGIILDSRRPQELAAVLKNLYQHPQRRAELGAAAREWVRTRLSHREMAARTAEFYGRLLGIHRRGGAEKKPL